MGNLLLYTESFTFSDSPLENRKALESFLDAGRHARENEDKTYFDNKIYEYPFPWGSFPENFAYASWEQIKQNDLLNWIPQPLYQSLSNFFFQNPSGRSSFNSFVDFEKLFLKELNGLLGCKHKNEPSQFVSCISTWHSWKIKFYQTFPERFIWEADQNDFLPNSSYTNELLINELKKHQKNDKLDLYNNDIGLTFHKEVMQNKGPSLKAYAIEIGGQIAEGNYYKLEPELSANESNASKGSYRRIYSFIGRKNKVQFISLDTAHGMFEFHDNTGKHLGEFRFDGGVNSTPEETHNLKTL